MNQPTPPEPQRPDPTSSAPLPAGSWYGIAGPGSAPPNPPPPPGSDKKSRDVRKLNRATAVAVSLSMVGILGLGTGIAVASAVNANDKVSGTTQLSNPGTGRQQLPGGADGDGNRGLNGDDDSGSGGSDDDSGGLFSQRTPPNSNSAPNGGFQRGVPGGGSHGSSGSS